MRPVVGVLVCAYAVALVCMPGSKAVTHSTLAILPSIDLNLPTLTQVDPMTLRPLGRRVALVQADTPTLSPDRSKAVFASRAVAALSFVDVASMRRLPRSVVVSDSARGLAALSWPTRRQVFALSTGANPLVMVYDTAKRQVTRRYRLRGTVAAVAATRIGLAVVLSPRGRVAPARLSLIAQRVRTLRLAKIPTGSHNHIGVGSPLLAIDAAGQHAYVSGGNGITVDVDLRTLRVADHALGRRAFLARRSVALAGHKLALVSDLDVLVVDTRSWRAVGSVSTASRLCWVGGTTIFCVNQNDLDLLDLTGAEQFNIHTSTPALGSQVVGTRAFLSYQQGSRYGILSLTSGKLTDVHAPLPAIIPGQPGLQPGTLP